MRKIITLMTSLLIFILTTGCLKNGTDSNNISDETTVSLIEENTETVETSIVIRPDEPVFVEKSILSEDISDKDAGTLISVKYELPVIKNPNNSTAIQSINDYLKNQSEEYFEKLRTETKEEVKEVKMLASSIFTPYIYERTFEVTYNNSGLLSILQLDYINSGGVHPNTERIAENFDIVTGKRIGAADILKGTDQEITEMINQSFITLINEEPNNYYAEASKIVAETPYEGFYLTDKAVIFFYQTYTISYYAFGYPEYSLSYTDYDKFSSEIKQ